MKSKNRLSHNSSVFTSSDDSAPLHLETSRIVDISKTSPNDRNVITYWRSVEYSRMAVEKIDYSIYPHTYIVPYFSSEKIFGYYATTRSGELGCKVTRITPKDLILKKEIRSSIIYLGI